MRIESQSFWIKLELPQPVGHRRYPDELIIARVRQRDGSWLWKVNEADYMDGAVLNRDLEWEWNSLPSSRTDEELQRTRYSSFEEALVHVEKYADSIMENT